MFDYSQLMHGILEGAILQIIQCETSYGYEIVQKLQNVGIDSIKEGSVYPLLLRLEKKGLIQAQMRPSAIGPSRKYYSITKTGKQNLAEFKAAWRKISLSMESLFCLEITDSTME